MNRIDKKKVSFLICFIFGLFLAFIIIQYTSIKFDFSNVKTIEVGNDYKVGATFFNRDVSSQVEKSGNINNQVVGKYVIEYSYTTFMNLTKSETIEVEVVDKEAPVITLIGNSKLTLPLGSKYIEQGYNVSDNYTKSVSVEITGEIDTNKAGTYYKTYTAEDSSGNKSSVKRTIEIVG